MTMIKNGWNDFKKNFPWKSMTIGFLIPKGMLFIGISLNALFAGAASVRSTRRHNLTVRHVLSLWS